MPNPPVPPPTAFAPHVPDGFKAPEEPIGGASPTAQQVRDAGDVAREITQSTTYEQDFTKLAPDPQELGGGLTSAKAWSDEVAATEAWLAYAKTQRDLAWQSVFAMAKELRPVFGAALQKRQAIATTYPQTKAFLEVWKVSAARGVATRAANKKAAKKPEGK